jgi:hypothetical protein
MCSYRIKLSALANLYYWLVNLHHMITNCPTKFRAQLKKLVNPNKQLNPKGKDKNEALYSKNTYSCP